MTYCSTGGLSLSDLLRKRYSPRRLGSVPSVVPRVQDRPPPAKMLRSGKTLSLGARAVHGRRCSVERGDVFPHAAALVVPPPELLHLDGEAAGDVRVQHFNGLAHPTNEIAYHSLADACRSAGGTRLSVDAYGDLVHVLPTNPRLPPKREGTGGRQHGGEPERLGEGAALIWTPEF